MIRTFRERVLRLRVLALAALLAAASWAVAGEPGARSAPPALPKAAPDVRLPSAFRKIAPESITDLRSIETRVKDVVAKVSPAVVSVSLRSGGNAVVYGSAVVVTADGLVLTAAHVAGTPNREVTFTFPDGRTAKGTTLGTNHDVDAGLMRITDAGPWPFAPLGDLADARLGDWMVALGHPSGFDAKRPVVARLGRLIVKTATTLQTDCTLLNGDSGGPLFDAGGRVVGIHSRISTNAEQNFHVPVSAYVQDWTRLAAGENWGTRPANVVGGRGGRGGPSATASAVPGGVRIDTVNPTGRAQRVKLQPGDIVLKFNGQPVISAPDFITALGATEEKLTVTIRRGDQQLDLEYTPNTGQGQGAAGLGTPSRSGTVPALLGQYRKNGEEIRHAFAFFGEAARRSVVRLAVDGKPVVLGAVVDADGWIATKASELVPGRLTAELTTGRVVDARVVAADEDNDLALVRIEAKGLEAVSWRKDESAPGEWVATQGLVAVPDAIGIISGPPRMILPARALLGVRFADEGESTWVSELTPGFGAERVGIKPGDVILGLNGVAMSTRTELTTALRELPAGRVVRVQVRRGDEELDFSVTLTAQAELLAQQSAARGGGRAGPAGGRGGRASFVGSGVSKRAEDFDLVLQHDTVLEPWECGGPLIDLYGRAVGLNIARVGREASYALPATLVQKIVAELKAQATTAKE